MIFIVDLNHDLNCLKSMI